MVHYEPAGAVHPHAFRLVLIGHGTWHKSDGSFIVPNNVILKFKGDDESNAMGIANAAEFNPQYNINSGGECKDYRLWPMIGEDLGVHSTESEWCPYHHAHHDGSKKNADHLAKFKPGQRVFMFSERSGDGPRLSSIITRVRQFVQHATLEIFWLACREHPKDSLGTVQGNMIFDNEDAPFRWKKR